MKLFSKKNLNSALIMGGGLILLFIILMRITSEGFANAKVMPSLMRPANSPSMGLVNHPICGPNQTHDKWGNCNCNPGYIKNGSIDYTTGTLKCVTNDCASTGGYIDNNGKCACSVGHSLNSYGTCMVNPDPQGCNSKIGMAPDSNGTCVCSNPPCSVKLSDNSACAYIGSPCADGYIQKDGSCGKSPASCF
jgi:hypothetical protein